MQTKNKKTAKVKAVKATKPTAKVVSIKNALQPAQIATAKKLLGKLKANPATNGVGKIAQIMQLYTNGFTQAQIVAYGFNRSTVYRQTGILNKLRNLKSKKLITGNGVVALTAKTLG
jgi:hypothetical protein